MTWKQAHFTHPTFFLPENMGWTKLDGSLVPKLMSLAPIPESCDEMKDVSCDVDVKQDANQRNVGLPCTGACKCRSNTDSR